ncbi:MAG: hypothetical protein ACREDP_19810, partial [Bradyrhizobium sp.]
TRFRPEKLCQNSAILQNFRARPVSGVRKFYLEAEVAVMSATAFELTVLFKYPAELPPWRDFLKGMNGGQRPTKMSTMRSI